MKNQIKSFCIFLVFITFYTVIPENALSQKLENGTISISWVNYRASAPEIREVFTEYTYYIKDSIVLRLQNESSTLMQHHIDTSGNKITDVIAHRINPVYLINLKTNKVHLLLNKKLEIDEKFDLEDFPEEAFFKAKYFIKDTAVENTITISNQKKENIAGIMCDNKSFVRNNYLINISYLEANDFSATPLNNFLPNFPYPIYKYSSRLDSTDLVTELITTKQNSDLPQFTNKYFNLIQ